MGESVLAYLPFLQPSPSPPGKQDSLPVCGRWGGTSHYFTICAHETSGAIQISWFLQYIFLTGIYSEHDAISLRTTNILAFKTSLRVTKFKIYPNFIWGLQVDFGDIHPNRWQVRQHHIEPPSTSHGQVSFCNTTSKSTLEYQRTLSWKSSSVANSTYLTYQVINHFWFSLLQWHSATIWYSVL